MREDPDTLICQQVFLRTNGSITPLEFNNMERAEKAMIIAFLVDEGKKIKEAQRT